jgi:alanyl-tRNA synthetase
VFIEFNRKADGKLEPLPAKHVDTGMGFERLCMALQGKKSNYDTDVFQVLIQEISRLASRPYGKNPKEDVAMRVMADHLRAVSFAIADGQLPSNNKAGYVIRRILRRAVRYGYTFLGFRDAVLCELVPVLAKQMGGTFPELIKQQELIVKVMQEEEQTFLRTLATGIVKFEQYVQDKKTLKNIDGKFAFELFDTYGFPIDLTQLMARELELSVDMDGFNASMLEQKNRSRQAAEVEHEDWVEVHPSQETSFVGYDTTECKARILRYRKITTKNKTLYQLVLDTTPFYAESGGQCGDKGVLKSDSGDVIIEDTRKENNLWVHLCSTLPAKPAEAFLAQVDLSARTATACNHSATHLLHAALKEVLGSHVEQKGSLVDPERLRFDFAHFSKMTDEEIQQTERIVNAKIRANIALTEYRELPIAQAREMGAVALFGEKYGDHVRVIAFDPAFSIELCGGTHISATGRIGFFKIVSEGAIAAGIRRIEAVTAEGAEMLIQEQFNITAALKEVLKGSKDLVKNAEQLVKQSADLQKQIQELQQEKAKGLTRSLALEAINHGDIQLVVKKLDLDGQTLKNLAFEMREQHPRIVCVFGTITDGKPTLTVSIPEGLVAEKKLDASQMVRELAKEINGGGGGQKFYATAGGKEASGLDKALEKATTLLASLI